MMKTTHGEEQRPEEGRRVFGIGILAKGRTNEKRNKRNPGTSGPWKKPLRPPPSS
jgi:hypothetical protein